MPTPGSTTDTSLDFDYDQKKAWDSYVAEHGGGENSILRFALVDAAQFVLSRTDEKQRIAPDTLVALIGVLGEMIATGDAIMVSPVGPPPFERDLDTAARRAVRWLDSYRIVRQAERHADLESMPFESRLDTELLLRTLFNPLWTELTAEPVEAPPAS